MVIHTLDIETSNTAETVKIHLEFALEIAKDLLADSSQHDPYYLNYNWGRFSLAQNRTPLWSNRRYVLLSC